MDEAGALATRRAKNDAVVESETFEPGSPGHPDPPRTIVGTQRHRWRRRMADRASLDVQRREVLQAWAQAHRQGAEVATLDRIPGIEACAIARLLHDLQASIRRRLLQALRRGPPLHHPVHPERDDHPRR